MKTMLLGMVPLQEANVDPIELAICLKPVLIYITEHPLEEGFMIDTEIDELERLLWDLNPEVQLLAINPRLLNPSSEEYWPESRFRYREQWADRTGSTPPAPILTRQRGPREWSPDGGDGIYRICFGDDQVYTAIEMGERKIQAMDVTSIGYYEILDILRQRWHKQFPEKEWPDK